MKPQVIIPRDVQSDLYYRTEVGTTQEEATYRKRILEFVTEKGPTSISDTYRTLLIPMPRVTSHLRRLVNEGILFQPAAKRYQISLVKPLMIAFDQTEDEEHENAVNEFLFDGEKDPADFFTVIAARIPKPAIEKLTQIEKLVDEDLFRRAGSVFLPYDQLDFGRLLERHGADAVRKQIELAEKFHEKILLNIPMDESEMYIGLHERRPKMTAIMDELRIANGAESDTEPWFERFLPAFYPIGYEGSFK